MNEGDVAWVGLAAYIAAYDIWAVYTGRPTLSAAFYRAAQHPKGRLITMACWSYLTAHLFRIIPRFLDPISYVENRRR
jgi:hypothetical protein